MGSELRVLLVERDDGDRGVAEEALAGIDGVRVSGVAVNRRIALARLRQEAADLVVVDVATWGNDPSESSAAIRQVCPDAGVVLVGAAGTAPPELVVRCLEAGALDLVAKPGRHQDGAARVRELRRLFRPLFGLFVARRAARGAVRPAEADPGPGRERPDGSRPAAPGGAFQAVAIAISTGGPNALAGLLPRMPADLAVPIFLVQHMPPQLTESLAAGLDSRCAVTVCKAVDGQTVAAGVVYLAPGGRHMRVVRVERRGTGPTLRIALNDEPPVNSCRPSADVLFRSLAGAYDGPVLAVVMTGMGNDGVEGVRVLRSRGGYCLSQSEESCTVYGMPRSVDEAGLSDERVDLGALPARILQLLQAAG